MMMSKLFLFCFYLYFISNCIILLVQCVQHEEQPTGKVRLKVYQPTIGDQMKGAIQSAKDQNVNDLLLVSGSFFLSSCLTILRVLNLPFCHPTVEVSWFHDGSVSDYDYEPVNWVTSNQRPYLVEYLSQCTTYKTREDIHWFTKTYSRFLSYGVTRNNCHHASLHLMVYLCDQDMGREEAIVFIRDIIKGKEKKYLCTPIDDGRNVSQAMPKTLRRLPKFVSYMLYPLKFFKAYKPGVLKRFINKRRSVKMENFAKRDVNQ